MKTANPTVHDYVRFLVEDKQRELQLLESRHRRGLIQPDDYRSCRRSLMQAIGQLEALSCGNAELGSRPDPDDNSEDQS